MLKFKESMQASEQIWQLKLEEAKRQAEVFKSAEAYITQWCKGIITWLDISKNALL